MIYPLEPAFLSLCDGAYADGYAVHGDMQLDNEVFRRRLQTIIEKHLGRKASPDAALMLFNSLHTNDLYLAVACGQQSETAWEAFLKAYRGYIRCMARFALPVEEAAIDLADSLPGHLFMPALDNKSRIASYDGHTSLATWLRVIIINLAINRQTRKANKHESMEYLPEMIDEMSLQRIETAVRANKYAPFIEAALRAASASLSQRERLIVLWRYDDGLAGQEIAQLLEVHP
jgi:RNA polymerase sigma factor (sigma-70 family)